MTEKQSAFGTANDFTVIVSREVMENVLLNMRIQAVADGELEGVNLDDPQAVNAASERVAAYIRSSVEARFPLPGGRTVADVDVKRVSEGLPARIVACALRQVDWNFMARGIVKDIVQFKRLERAEAARRGYPGGIAD